MWQGYYEFNVSQWGVGHGGFHSQSIVFQAQSREPTAAAGKGSLVRVIYDCGSGTKKSPRRALNDAVQRMLNDVPDDSKIDLLVISHFDQDHINGLRTLAAEFRPGKRNIAVARVWAPVLTKIEALFAIATSNLTGAALDAYANFLDDPTSGLGELFDGAEVITIPPDGDPIPLAPSVADDEDDGGDGEIILLGDPVGRGLFAKNGRGGASEALWEFQPYVVASTLHGAQAVAALSGVLGKPVEQCSFDDLINLANDKKLLSKFHMEVHKHNMKIKKKARASGSNRPANLSTLCIYSGPVSPYDWCRFRKGWLKVDTLRRAIPNAPAWLGTGDAGLLEPQHVNAMRVALTESRLDRVGISSAPHHGSRNDSSAHLWNSMANLRWVTIEADGGKKHPHNEVLTELATRSLTVHTCTAGNDFHWSDKGIR